MFGLYLAIGMAIYTISLHYTPEHTVDNAQFIGELLICAFLWPFIVTLALIISNEDLL